MQRNARHQGVCILAFRKNLTLNFCFVTLKSTDKTSVPTRSETDLWQLLGFTMRKRHSIVSYHQFVIHMERHLGMAVQYHQHIQVLSISTGCSGISPTCVS